VKLRNFSGAAVVGAAVVGAAVRTGASVVGASVLAGASVLGVSDEQPATDNNPTTNATATIRFMQHTLLT
jgi:serine acetyltransferase